MIVLLLVLFILIINVVFNVPMYAIILVIAGIITLGVVIVKLNEKANERTANSIVKAALIKEVGVYKRKAEHSGFSVTWDERRDHYTYKDVLDHYDCFFAVTYESGQSGIIKCTKGGFLYCKLMDKTKK